MSQRKPPDPRGGHTRLYWELQDSMAFRALDFSAQALWLAMRRKLQSTNNGNIEATLSYLVHCGFKSSATLAKGLRSLQALGLIAQTRQGGIAHGSRFCSLYRFTDEEVFAHPRQGVAACKATNEWRAFTTLAHANATLREAHASAKRPQKNKVGLHFLKPTDSISEACASFQASLSEQERVSLLQKVNKARTPRPPANPRQH